MCVCNPGKSRASPIHVFPFHPCIRCLRVQRFAFTVLCRCKALLCQHKLSDIHSPQQLTRMAYFTICMLVGTQYPNVCPKALKIFVFHIMSPFKWDSGSSHTHYYVIIVKSVFDDQELSWSNTLNMTQQFHKLLTE